MDWTSEEPVCACCGASRDTPYGVSAVCAVCGWVDDPAAPEDAPSAENDGLSLFEARLNFRTFGAILPPCEWDD